MIFPGWRDWVFSLKAFAGALAALWLAMYLGLERPYWAMATAYIVAQPVTGALRSKAAYRFAGTAFGAVATLVLVPNLVDAPALLVAALSLWVAGCIYCALLDRGARGYLFLLAGYTAALIGFPAVETPGAIWDIVLSRVEEISLGIACSTLIGTIILPTPLGPALAARIEALLLQARTSTQILLSGSPDEASARAARRKLAADAVEIGGLATHLAYDTSAYGAAAASVSLLHHRVILLLPVLSGIADRIAVLRDCGGVPGDVRGLLDRVSAWLGAREAILAGSPAMHAAIAALEPEHGPQPSWHAITLGGLLMRLHELTDIAHDIAALRRQFETGRRSLPALAVAAPTSPPRHRDHFMAAYSGAAAAAAIGLVSCFWIATAWPDGANAASLTAVACSFFAAQDDPVPSLIKFTYAALIAMVIDAVYLFAILPRAHDFEMLALALAPLYLPLGVLIAQPRTAAAAGPVAFLTATLLALSSSYTADFPGYVNASIAAILGLVTASVTMRLVRSVSGSWTARRLVVANRADIAEAAAGAGRHDRMVLAGLMLDRLTEIVPRLAVSVEGADLAARTALAEIRVGINVVDLRHAAAEAPAPEARALSRVLDGVATHFHGTADEAAPAALLDAIDTAIQALGAAEGTMRKSALLALGGLRRALFREAPAYEACPDPPPRLELAA